MFYNILPRCQFHKHLKGVIYGQSKISWCILKRLHVMSNGYFVRAVNYACKMFMKSTKGVDAVKLFIFTADTATK